MATASMGPDRIGIPDIAQRLGVGTRKLYRLIGQGHLRGYRLGRVFRIRRDDFDDLLNEDCVEPGDLEHLLDIERSHSDGNARSNQRCARTGVGGGC